MREALPGSINNQGGLTNGGEVVVLYHWDGATDLVQDLDYAVWGDKVEAVDKTGVAIDGPDPDSTTTTYFNDTAIASQDVTSIASHLIGESYTRVDKDEGTETLVAGNGITGHDETSENLSTTFADLAVTPNGGSLLGIGVSIDDVAILEGDGGETTFTFTITLTDPAPPGGVSYDISTTDGTATVADLDYDTASDAQDIAEGELTEVFNVIVNGDVTGEINEQFFVEITNVVGTNAEVLDGTGVGTILNDDDVAIHIIQGAGEVFTPRRKRGDDSRKRHHRHRPGGILHPDPGRNRRWRPGHLRRDLCPPRIGLYRDRSASWWTSPGPSPSSTVSPNSMGRMPSFQPAREPLPAPDRLRRRSPRHLIRLTPSCAIEYECYEGMLVTAAGNVVGPTQFFGSDPEAEFLAIATTGAMPFREIGAEYPGFQGVIALPPGVPVFDGNPEIFEVDPDKLGQPNVIAKPGDTYAATGPLAYEFGDYEIWAAAPVSPTPGPSVVVPVRPATPTEMTIASLNMFRLYDDIDDPGIQDDIVSSAEYLIRRTKFRRYILDVLRAPDVIGLQEIEKLDILNALAADIEAEDPSVSYSAHLVPGNNIYGMNVGYLVRDTVESVTVTQLGFDDILVGWGYKLFDHPPLMVEGTWVGDGSASFDFAALNNHTRSLGGVDEPFDDFAREKRFQQAQSIAQKVQDFQTAGRRTPRWSSSATTTRSSSPTAMSMSSVRSAAR